MIEVIIAFAIPIICGLLSTRAINRFLNGEIEQWSLEYQLCGYVGMNVFAFGLIAAFGVLSAYLN